MTSSFFNYYKSGWMWLQTFTNLKFSNKSCWKKNKKNSKPDWQPMTIAFASAGLFFSRQNDRLRSDSWEKGGWQLTHHQEGGLPKRNKISLPEEDLCQVIAKWLWTVQNVCSDVCSDIFHPIPKKIGSFFSTAHLGFQWNNSHSDHGTCSMESSDGSIAEDLTSSYCHKPN